MIGCFGVTRYEDVDINRAYNTSVNKKKTTNLQTINQTISLEEKHKLQV
jgi:hypothetical protein